jgi:hypothetical protein
MPTQQAYQAAGGTTRRRAGDAVVGTFVPTDAPQREDILSRLRQADLFLATTTARNAVSWAEDAQWTTSERVVTLEGVFNKHVARWTQYKVPLEVSGSTWLIDYGQKSTLQDMFREAMGGTWASAAREAYRLQARWSDLNRRIATAYLNGLHALGRWYAAQRADEAEAAAAGRAELQARADEAAAQAQAEWERGRPGRMKKLGQFLTKLKTSEGRSAQAFRSKLAQLGGPKTRAALIVGIAAAEAAADAGADEAAQEQAAEVALAAEVGLLGVLYPLSDPAVYVATWSTLPLEWQALYLADLYPDDPAVALLPLADPSYYATTYPQLSPPWLNLFVHRVYQPATPAAE